MSSSISLDSIASFWEIAVRFRDVVAVISHPRNFGWKKKKKTFNSENWTAYKEPSAQVSLLFAGNENLVLETTNRVSTEKKKHAFYGRREIVEDYLWFVFISCNPEINHTKIEKYLLLFTAIQIFSLYWWLKRDGKSFIFCRLPFDTDSCLISLITVSIHLILKWPPFLLQISLGCLVLKLEIQKNIFP